MFSCLYYLFDGFLKLNTFRYRLSVLNVASLIFLAVVVIYTLLNAKILLGEGGWGMVGMVGLSLIGITGLAINLILQFIFRIYRNLIVADLVALAGMIAFHFYMSQA